MVKFDIEDRVGYITLNRPEKRNALSYDMVTELKAAFKEAADNGSVKVIVLRAEGKVFCAGADLGYIQSLQTNSYEENLVDSRHLMELFLQIYTMPKVVIAQINGHAIAGGCGLATVCDISFSVPEATFGYTEVRIGFIPAIVKVFLLRKIGEGHAKEMLLSGDLYTAEEVKSIGLINKIAPADKLADTVKEYAVKLCTSNSGHSMGTTKQMIAEVQQMGLQEGLEFAAKKNATGRATQDCQKGIASFLNKEKPVWD